MSSIDLNGFMGYDKIGMLKEKLFSFILMPRSFYLAFHNKTVKLNQTKINLFIAQTRYNGPQMNTYDAVKKIICSHIKFN